MDLSRVKVSSSRPAVISHTKVMVWTMKNSRRVMMMRRMVTRLKIKITIIGNIMINTSKAHFHSLRMILIT